MTDGPNAWVETHISSVFRIWLFENGYQTFDVATNQA